jgi:UDP-GlcNAc:undecaprenyl-phosphate GlcNAc-1-phosphate transferase|tara:strand:- start:10 stop:1068 length:1059 start_codon:yes stop_codon:yes gene_type:complete
MLSEINLSFFITFSLLSFLVTYLISKYSEFFFSGSLLDKDFLKPQAFHKQPIARIGGLAILLSFIFFVLLYFFIFDVFLNDYFTVSLLLFTLGFLDDLKIKINPNMRLALMLILLLFCINTFSIQITTSGLSLLNLWLENNVFQICFVLLCFLFIINGANLIDGFNGLLAIHFLLINSIFLIINLLNQNESLSIILSIQIIIVLSFLLFNFPKAKIFLGDSGSYLLGSLIVLNTIKTYELNVEISPFFFAGVLFYLFYEVFFSFIRKIKLKRSPLKPDKNHLHMLLYSWLFNVKKIKNSNYLTSLLINSCYLFLQIPLFYFQNNGLISRYWFFSLIILYTVIYFRLYSFSKK